MDTSDDTPAATEEDMSDKENTVIEDSSNELSSNEDDCEPGNTSAVQSVGGDSGSSGSSSSAIKGKRTKGEVVEQVVTKVMKKVTEGLRDGDRLYAEMEQKRLQFEVQQKWEERQFQLQMMQCIFRSGAPHQGHLTDEHSNYYPMYPPAQYHPENSCDKQ